MFFVRSGEKNECFKENSGLRFALERPKGESESIRRFCHD
ncbi:hypothetical protein SynWH8103_01016 [Synechococcus sp. WH 8103]|jgi:hypothetical protein|nr:hypothetical protein SynA18461_00987 [Synechococcus sp. A18-46.1]CRY91752.1 hypothetical protein SynWH8103_01016 [Synechococcus sp. WH 8103]|tara:strand:+ start:613 stop:732 length:120 start_codon:yes stop_codon:yes gene_type:complete